MAKTIPQLTDATTVNAADELIVQQGGITKRATVSELKAQMANFESNDIATTGSLEASTAQLSDTGWNNTSDPTFGRSTPENNILSLGGHYDELGSAGRNYKWGIQSWMTNPSTMPMTNIDAVSQGWFVRGGGFAARQVGADGDGHAVEVLSGQWAAEATVSTTSGSPVLTVTDVPFRGSRFCVGDPISGTNIPAAATIVSVTKGAQTVTGNTVQALTVVSGGTGYAVNDIVTLSGGTSTFAATAKVLSVSGGAITALLVTDGGNYTVDPAGTLNLTGGSGSGATCTATMIVAGFGNPSSITISANATASGTGITATVLSSKDNQNIGILVSGSGNGGTDGNGNKNGRGIQFQSYGNAAFLYGINYGASALRSDGTGIRFSSGTASRGISFESFNFDQAIRISGGTFANFIQFTGTTSTGSAISFGTVTATSGINFASSNTFSTAAIVLSGQNIATDTTTGMQVATSATQKLGFFGRTPVARPAVIADATDAASTQARLNDLLAAIRTLGLIAT